MGKEEASAFDFGIQIKTLRKERGWSQQQLGNFIGVSKQTIFGYEANVQTPPFEKVKRMAEVFRVSLDYLVGWDKVPTLLLTDFTEEQREIFYRLAAAFQKDNAPTF